MPQLLNKQVHEIGYGLMGLTWRAPEHQASDEQSIKCMETAFSKGINLWNGGEFYGTPDRNSLHILNKYFTKHPDQADKVLISIKGGGKPPTPHPDGSAANVRRSIDECLRVLDGKKSLDLFECARVDPNVPIEITIGAIAEYVKAGKLGGISLSECSADSIRRASKVHKIACVEVEFSLWATEILDNDVAKTCAELDIPIIAYSPLGRGFLTGQIKSLSDIPENDFRRGQPRFQPDTFKTNLELVHKVQKLADKKGVTPGQIGVAWVIKQGTKPGMPTVIPIPGASSPGRIEENSVHVDLSKEDEDEIDKILAGTQIVGGRYQKEMAGLNFGDSPPLQS